MFGLDLDLALDPAGEPVNPLVTLPLDDWAERPAGWIAAAAEAVGHALPITVGVLRRPPDARIAPLLAAATLTLTAADIPDQPDTDRRLVRVPDLDAGLALLRAAVAASPRAALACGRLLRQTERLDTDGGLAAEAAVYSTLLGGPEFARWLAARAAAAARPGPTTANLPTTPTTPDGPTAADAPTARAGTDGPTAPTAPAATRPTEPYGPTGPTAPAEPDRSAEPDAPAGPDAPTVPAKPDAPTVSTAPAEPGAPDTPAKPDRPTAPDAPAKPDGPSAPAGTGPTEPYGPIGPDASIAPAEPDGPTAPTRPDEPLVLLDRVGGRLSITLNRPRRRNALSFAMRDELLAALQVAAFDPAVTEVWIGGAGPAFCAGGDLAEFGTATDPVAAYLVRLARAPWAIIDRLADRVTVRAHGACVGAGAEMAAFAGRVVAAPDAFFALPEVSMGLVPGAGGTVSVPRRVGRWRAAWLMLTGERLDAAAALRWGLVDAIESA